MTLLPGKRTLTCAVLFVTTITFLDFRGKAVSQEKPDLAARRKQALARREWLNKLLADYLKKYPESDLNDDGRLTSPERSKHVGKLYRVEKLKELGDRIQFKGDIEYARVDSVSLTLDLYLPRTTEPQNRPSLVTWFHGGGWRGGSKDQCIVAWLATEGFAVASIEYRSTLQAPFPANIHDCKGAIRWLRASAGEYGYETPGPEGTQAL